MADDVVQQEMPLRVSFAGCPVISALEAPLTTFIDLHLPPGSPFTPGIHGKHTVRHVLVKTRSDSRHQHIIRHMKTPDTPAEKPTP